MTSDAWKATVLASCAAASPLCADVTIDTDQVAAVADWMRFEVFPPIGGDQPDAERPSLPDRDAQIDFALVTTAINFAYTDFETGVPWSVEHEGRELVDADAMFLRFEQAVAAGVPVLSGAWLAGVTEAQLAEVLHGPRPIPLLAERVRVLNEIGAVLVERYGGRFSAFVADCPPRAYADGAGLLERLTAEFGQFDDSGVLHGVPVRLDKLAQLGVWTLHRLGLVALEDLDSLSVFADYIVPAALRAMRVLHYSPALAAEVDAGRVVPAGSDLENEIRVQTVVACALLTDALNERRSAPVVNAQVDYRFWSAFHDLIRPHHLTITTRY
ncbi:queuosine salvage family protein [Nocardioides sp. YIM 152588]|uniref:queuosine salvage family protein n=1 Tax=Nocardioides sp. YIM 152588 TaxID=3158259 RepID=UPI0032E4FFEA